MRDRQRREFPGLIFQPATTALLRYCERQRRNDSAILEALAEGILEHIPPGHYSKKIKMTNHYTALDWDAETLQEMCGAGVH